MSYYQMIEQGLRTVCSDGEFIIVRHQRNEAYVRRWNLDLPFQYETVEPEMLATHVRTWPGRGGAKYDVVNGIVLDKNGNRLGYLFLEKHPSKGGREVRFIDAEFIIHFFEVERAGQQRGISAFVGGVQTLYDLGDLSDATLKSAKMSAALMLILGVVPDAKPEDVQVGHSDAAWSDDVYAAGEIPGREPAYTLPSGNTIEDVHGRKMERLQAGGVARVAKGTDVNKIEPDSAGGFEAFEKSGIRRFAAGPGVHFESLSQNWTDSNYASFRGSMIPVRRDAQHWRDMLVERVIDILWQDVIVGGYIMNAWGFDGYWSPDEITQEERIMIMPPEETVDPEKDARANQAMLDSGEMDLEELLIRKGTTLDERFRSISKQRALAKKHGVEDWLDERLARNYKGAKGADVAATQEDATQ